MRQLPSPPSHTNHAAMGFGMLGGAFAWLIHFLSLSLVAEWGIFADLHHVRWMEVSAVAWIVLAITPIAAAIAVFAMLAAWRMLRVTEHASGVSDIAKHNTRFLARTGFVTSAVFLGIIIVETIPVFFFLRG